MASIRYHGLIAKAKAAIKAKNPFKAIDYITKAQELPGASISQLNKLLSSPVFETDEFRDDQGLPRIHKEAIRYHGLIAKAKAAIKAKNPFKAIDYITKAQELPGASISQLNKLLSSPVFATDEFRDDQGLPRIPKEARGLSKADWKLVNAMASAMNREFGYALEGKNSATEYAALLVSDAKRLGKPMPTVAKQIAFMRKERQW